MNAEPPTLMTGTEIAAYADFLSRITRNKRGSLAERLGNAAAQLRQMGNFT